MKKKKKTELSCLPASGFPCPRFRSFSFAWIIPVVCLHPLCYAFLSTLYHSHLSFTSCTLTSALPPIPGPGDPIILFCILSLVSSAVTQDKVTEWVAFLWFANPRWTLLSGSFPLKCPPFSRWWERGADTQLSHTPTPCLQEMYLSCPRSGGRNRSVATSACSFLL